MKVIKWINYKYIKDNKIKEADFDIKHQNALIKELVKNKYIICGDSHQFEEFNCIPLFKDGYIELSMRKWSEIMEIAYLCINPIISAQKNPNFYMTTLCNIEEKRTLHKK